MRRAILAAIVVACFAVSAAAEDAAKPKPPTIEDLQQQVDYWKAAYQAAAQQRNQAQAALADMQTDAFARAQQHPPEVKK